jgi:hypothetical protein
MFVALGELNNLKAQPKFELHRPRAALLVLSCNSSKASVKHGRGLSERRISDRGIDVSEIRSIEHVERFRAEL